jgi:hypothetical protein
MRYQYYVRAVNQQSEGKLQKISFISISIIFQLEINSTYAIEPPVYNTAFAGDSGNYKNLIDIFFQSMENILSYNNSFFI